MVSNHFANLMELARIGELKLTQDAQGFHLFTTDTIARQLADMPVPCTRRLVPEGAYSHEVDIPQLKRLIGHAGWNDLQISLTHAHWNKQQANPVPSRLEQLLACIDHGSLKLIDRHIPTIIAKGEALELLRADVLPNAPDPAPKAGLPVDRTLLTNALGLEAYETLMTRMRGQLMREKIGERDSFIQRLKNSGNGGREI